MSKRCAFALVAVLALLSVRQAEAGVSVTFYDVLSPIGVWVDVEPYGTVWQPDPRVVGPDFYPYYSGGHWVETEYGWTWVSDWEWGWVPFHHGRWLFSSGYGWVWVPGDEWGPAWVDWRIGGGYVGWVPLGPAGASYRSRWCWVPTRVFPRRDFHRFRLGAESEVRAYHAASAAPRGPDVRAVVRVAGAVESRTLGAPRALTRGEVRSEARVVQPPPGRAVPPARAEPPRREERVPQQRIEPPRREQQTPPQRVEPPRRDEQTPPQRIEPPQRQQQTPPERIEPPQRQQQTPPERIEPRREPQPPPQRIEPTRPPEAPVPPQRREPPRFEPQPQPQQGPTPGQPQPQNKRRRH